MAKFEIDKRDAEKYRKMSGIGWLPDNVATYLSQFYSTLAISVCGTDVENGYGEWMSRALEIKLPFKKCNNCGYHSLWNPDDSESKCLRHTYGKKGWETVFLYDLDHRTLSLEKAFDNFLELQSGDWRDPVKYYSATDGFICRHQKEKKVRESKTAKVPNDLLDALIEDPNMTIRKARILLYIIRQTYGYHRETTQKQADLVPKIVTKTGIARTHVYATLKELIDQGVLIRDKDKRIRICDYKQKGE